MAEIVKDLYTIEILDPLYRTADERLKRLGYTNVHTRLGDGTKGRGSPVNHSYALPGFFIAVVAVSDGHGHTVSGESRANGLEIYRFLKAAGGRFIQFNPVVERLPTPAEQVLQLHFAQPPGLSLEPPSALAELPASAAAVSPQSVEREAYGDFLIAVFDEWVRNDVGTVHVMNFEWALASWLQLPASVCLFSPRCGKALIVEHSGEVYSCDHFMYPDYRLGNIAEDDLQTLASSAAQQAFGAAKQTTLPAYCQRCPYLFACHGECPKNRFTRTPDGEVGLNYLCPSYKKYFAHITEAMNALGQIVSQGFAASTIMDAYKGPLLLKH